MSAYQRSLRSGVIVVLLATFSAQAGSPSIADQAEDRRQRGAEEGRELALRTILPLSMGRSDSLDAQLFAGLASGEAGPSLSRPDTRNPLLADLLQGDHGLALFKAIGLRFKSFDNDGDASLGVAFDYEKHDPYRIRQSGKSHVRGLSYRIDVNGNVAFERNANPADFISSRLSFEYFWSDGGTKGPLDADSQRKASKLAKDLSAYATTEAVLASPEWAKLSKLAKKVLDTQFYWEAGLTGGYETNQDFTEENFTIGGHAAVEINAWNDNSVLARANVFDYPAAALRLLTGYDEDWMPRGNAIPTPLVALEHVEPEGMTPRAAAGDESSYQRVRFELIYKSPVGLVAGDEYWLVAGFHGFQELDASNQVEAAGLDYYGFLELSLEADGGLFVSFGTGQRPFDPKDEEFVELGWKFNF